MGMRRLVLLTCLGVLSVPLWGQAPSTAGPVRPPVPTLREDLRRILARREYNFDESQWFQQWLYRALHSLAVWWREHFAPYVDALYEKRPFIYWTIVAVGALAAAFLLYHILHTVRSAFGRSGRGRHSRGELPPTVLQTDPERLLKQADEAAANGDFPEALRRLYLALIRNLDRHGLVRFDRSRTNYEYVRQLRAHDTVAVLFADLTGRAERVWYGDETLAPVDYEQCRALALAAWQGEGHAAH